MKILIFDYEYPPVGGGGGIVNALIAEELACRHAVTVITSAYDALPRREMRGGVEVVRVPVIGRTDKSVASLPSMLSYPPAAWLAAARLLRGRRFDVINSHFAVPTGPGSLPVARLSRTPHVISIHGGDIYDPSKRISPHRSAALRAVVAAVLRGSDRVVAQSSNTRDNVYRYYRYRGPIDIVPLGIRQPEVAPATRRQLGLPEDEFLAVTVGRLVPRKAIGTLLDALALPGGAQVHLVVLGAGPELGALERHAATRGLSERVRFLGWVDEPRKWQILRVADAYLSATMHEGFGLVYLEAMASGLPVITPNHGGQVDFLRDGETGFLVPPGDAERLAAAIGRLRADPALAARMRETNLALAPAHRIEHCAAAYERLLDATAGAHGARS
ncbi:MAG TPA: glycosyltransferase family 4 protein [Gemmatimonadales bacterium]|nr:glycosyltransferase family 4 protein [Gemmatimonadales bacterium]